MSMERLGALVGIDAHLVHVELERIRARRLDQLGMAQPAPRRDPIERRHDRNLHGGLETPDLLQVVVGSHGERFALGDERQRFGERLRMIVGVTVRGELFQGDLLFEQRAHDDGGRAGVFGSLGQIQIRRDG
jgi:hypothetical protein